MRISPASSLLSIVKENCDTLKKLIQKTPYTLSDLETMQTIIDKTLKMTRKICATTATISRDFKKSYYFEVQQAPNRRTVKFVTGTDKVKAMPLPDIITFVSTLTSTLGEALTYEKKICGVLAQNSRFSSSTEEQKLLETKAEPYHKEEDDLKQGAKELSSFCKTIKNKYESKWGNSLTGKICLFVYKLFNIKNTKTIINGFNTAIEQLDELSGERPSTNKPKKKNPETSPNTPNGQPEKIISIGLVRSDTASE